LVTNQIATPAGFLSLVTLFYGNGGTKFPKNFQKRGQLFAFRRRDVRQQSSSLIDGLFAKIGELLRKGLHFSSCAARTIAIFASMVAWSS